MTVQTVRINGVSYPVQTVRRQTPRSDPHAYVLEDETTVYRVGAEWRLQAKGEWPVSVVVDERTAP